MRGSNIFKDTEIEKEFPNRFLIFYPRKRVMSVAVKIHNVRDHEQMNILVMIASSC